MEVGTHKQIYVAGFWGGGLCVQSRLSSICLKFRLSFEVSLGIFSLMRDEFHLPRVVFLVLYGITGLKKWVYVAGFRFLDRFIYVFTKQLSSILFHHFDFRVNIGILYIKRYGLHVPQVGFRVLYEILFFEY